VSRKLAVLPERDEAKNTQSNSKAFQCFKCNTCAHEAANCPTTAKHCFLCGKQGHEARSCRSGGWRSGGQGKDGDAVPESKPTVEEVKSCTKDERLLLACGKKIPSLSSACANVK